MIPLQVAFGLLCSAGLATMAEILDIRGPWNMDLVETMLPVALEIEVNRERANYRATGGAVATLFSKEAATEYEAKLAKLVKDLRGEQMAGVLQKDDLNAQAADTVMDFFGTSKYMRKTGGKNGR